MTKRARRYSIKVMLIKVFFDGSCEPVNPGGNVGVGAVIYWDGKRIAAISDNLGSSEKTSNNVAEYEALAYALEFLRKRKMENESIEVYGDSMIVINACKKQKASKGLCAESSHRVIFLASQFPHAKYFWIPREQNCEADILSRKYYPSNGKRFFQNSLQFDKDFLTNEYLKIYAREFSGTHAKTGPIESLPIPRVRKLVKYRRSARALSISVPGQG